ncbi:response regulator, partial [Pelomonas sp. KK5]|uniref:response regulator n=1 Tax=Pelomonas sp. KK5 TaxID=1855730 RepID=UPI001301D9B9
IVRLPLLADATRPGTPPRGEGELERLAGRRVLIADDNADAANSLALLLELIGSEATVVNNGLEAVARSQQLLPELVFLDIGMPGLNGYEVCARLKALPGVGQAMVVVALTGWGQEKDRLRGREAGFDGHLVKPVSPEAIRSLVAELRL